MRIQSGCNPTFANNGADVGHPKLSEIEQIQMEFREDG
jgi:hypothetical protein